VDATLDDALLVTCDELPDNIDVVLPADELAALPGGKTGPICWGVIPVRSLALLATAPTVRRCFFFTKSGPDSLTIIDALSVCLDVNRGS
tara:strand:+ start:1069 stop:1338 length:270 start_codon:yes stop_codon:yes gene_type:complete